jgi:hypothetical protein
MERKEVGQGRNLPSPVTLNLPDSLPRTDHPIQQCAEFMSDLQFLSPQPITPVRLCPIWPPISSSGNRISARNLIRPSHCMKHRSGCHIVTCALTVIAPEQSRKRAAKYWYESKHRTATQKAILNDKLRSVANLGQSIGRSLFILEVTMTNPWHLYSVMLPLLLYHVAILDRNAQNSVFELIGPCRMEPRLG